MNPLVQLMHDAAKASLAAGAGKLPLYQQLQRALRQAIDNGVYGPSSALPADRQLAL